MNRTQYPVSAYLSSSAVVDFETPSVATLAKTLAGAGSREELIARCFSWVRDNIHHSADVESDVVTCAASEVLREKVGLCYAKSHLLVALLRANGLPAAFSYQRLSLDGGTDRYCLHGLVSVHVPQFGWYRVDHRGGKRGSSARYAPPVEQLVYTATQPGEFDLPDVYHEPMEPIVKTLENQRSMKVLLNHLPDLTP